MKRYAAFLTALFLLSLRPAAGEEDRSPRPAEERREAAVETLRVDIRRAEESLLGLREETARERAALASRIETLRGETAALRRTAQRRRSDQGRLDRENEALAAENEALAEEARFLLRLASEYRRVLETRTPLGPAPDEASDLQAIDALLERAQDPSALPAALGRLLDFADRWNRNRLGGRRYPGTAIDGAGREREGQFAVIGPLAYFSDGEEVAGPARPRLNAPAPAVWDRMSARRRRAVAALVRGEEARVPVDVTGGDVFSASAARASPLRHAAAGGVVMIPLFALGGLALVLSLLKARELRRWRFPADDLPRRLAALLREGDAEGAERLASSRPFPLGRILREGCRARAAPREGIEEAMHERVLSLLPRLERHLGLLAVLGASAPLLGLLGTVTGMIRTFRLVTLFGTGDARLLSGGISEALITTQTGLVIAIPVLLAHAFFSRRVRTLLADLEAAAADFIEALHPGAPERAGEASGEA